MNQTKRFFAIILSFAMMFSLLAANVENKAQAAQDDKDTITVTLRVEDPVNTLVPPTKITLDKSHVESLNQTFNAEAETPTLETGYITAAHALASYISSQTQTPTTDLRFAYKNPSYIKGQEVLDSSYFWSYRVNNTSPVMADGFTQYNFTECPIKDGDSIVVFRQYYNWETNESSSYAYFDKDEYTTKVNENIPITLYEESMDENWNPISRPLASMPVHVSFVSENGEVQFPSEMVSTNLNGTLNLSYDKAGTYYVHSLLLNQDMTPVYSRAFAILKVTGESAPATPTPTNTPISSVTPAPVTPVQTVAPTAAPSLTATPSVKPSTPKKLSVKVKKNKKAAFSWKKVKDASGYELIVAKKGKKICRIVVTSNKTSITKKFKKGKYTVKCRSYKLSQKKKVYSRYTKSVSFSIKA